MSQVIYSTTLHQYTPISWVGKLVYTDADLLRSVLRTELGEAYAELFSVPSISSEALRYHENAYWLSDFVQDPLAFSKLDVNEQEKIAARLQGLLQQILDLAEQLKTDRAKRELGELLTRAIEIPSLDCIRVQNDRITFVLWGFISDEAREKKFNIRKELSEYNRTLRSPSPNADIVDRSSVPTIDLPSPVVRPAETSPDQFIEVRLYIQPTHQEPIILNDFLFQFAGRQETHRSDEKGIYRLTDVPQGEVKVSGQFNGKTYKGKFSRISQQDTYAVQLTSRSKLPAWLWWLLVVLLILLLSWWLWSRFAHPGHAFLPESPEKLRPIDSTKVRRDPSDPLRRRIVGNRLNLLIDREVTLETFADRLAEQFDPDQLTITHYEAEFNIIQVEFFDNDLTKWRSSLKKIPGVISVIPESIVNDNQASGLPGNDPGFQDARAAYYFAVIKAYDSWKQTTGKAEIVVAVVDGGIDISHPELKGQLTKSFDVYSESSDIPLYLHDDGGHGTHVGGLIAGRKDNHEGLSGVAPGCRLMPIQISDSHGILSTMATIKGVAYAIKQEARVINLSLGAQLTELTALPLEKQEEFARNQLLDEAAVWQEIFAYARQKGTVVVKAAGNDNVLAQMDPMNRSADIILVGATDRTNQRAPFSNFGPGVVLSAPGVDIVSSLPGNKFGALSGTSMAAPIVSGGVAWLLSINPALTFEQVRDHFVRTGLAVPADNGRKTGPIIQLTTSTPPSDPCGPLIDSLRREIERLRQQPDSNNAMRMPEKPLNCAFAKGNWRSSENLVNYSSKEKLDVYFQFDGQCAGNIIVREITSGNTCRSPLSTMTINGKMLLLETPVIPCANGNSYTPMRIECQADEDGNAQCRTSNTSAGEVLFKLYRQRQPL